MLALALAFAPWLAVAVQGAPTWRPDLAPAVPPHHVQSMVVFDDGSGPALIAVGLYPDPTQDRWLVVRWDGDVWQPLGEDLGNVIVPSLAVVDDGSGQALFVGWKTSSGTSRSSIARWNGTSWDGIGNGQVGEVLALLAFDDGHGPALIAGGNFPGHVARWDGTGWTTLGDGTDGLVQALEVFDDGRGPALYAGGLFATAGGIAARNVARWDGTSWEALGAGHAGVIADLQSLPASGAAPARLCATGDSVKAWDGEAWSLLGTSNFFVQVLGVYDDGTGAGPALYAGGQFSAIGGVAATRVARYDASGWHALESGLDSVPNCMAVFDEGDGTGPALFVGSDAGIARWQGLPDLDPPVLACPPDLRVIDALPALGEPVHFAVGIQDRDPNVRLVCMPPSGSLFPLGTTPVVCTAVDGSGNLSSCSFLVRVAPKLRPR